MPLISSETVSYLRILYIVSGDGAATVVLWRLPGQDVFICKLRLFIRCDSWLVRNSWTMDKWNGARDGKNGRWSDGRMEKRQKDNVENGVWVNLNAK